MHQSPNMGAFRSKEENVANCPNPKCGAEVHEYVPVSAIRTMLFICSYCGCHFRVRLQDLR